MLSDALKTRMEAAGADWMSFGPAVRENAGGTEVQVEAAEDFGQFEAEYAAIRRNVGVMHLPWRRVIPVTGRDVSTFLHALLTQDVKSTAGGGTRPALLLDAKGHVLADLLVHRGDAETWLDLDVFDALAVREALEAKLFAEDVRFGQTDRVCFAVLGPACFALIEALRVEEAEPGHPPLTETGVHQVVSLGVADEGPALAASVFRHDDAGVPGLRVWVPGEHAAAAYAALLDAAGFLSQDPTEAPEAFAARRRESLRGRPVGWSAYNTARIEAGTPLFHVDFGPTNLPAEAGLVETHVSFTKGCYPGQEAVARMKNLGHPKKLLVSLEVGSEGVPVAGTEVFDAEDPGRVVGAVTSSAASPLRGQKALAIAMVRWGKHEAGTAVRVAAGGSLVEARVAPLGDQT
ncbi:MAG: glycine cleavage T C-terminal barrel domain-containing protein [Planctomycetota bacterium]